MMLLLLLAMVFSLNRQRYIMTSREVKRWDATSRSPVYASLSTTLKVRAVCVGGEIKIKQAM